MTKLEEEVRLLSDTLQDVERTFSLVAPRTSTVRLPDGSYRKKPINGGEKFIFEAARVGKKGGVILSFIPMGVLMVDHRGKPGPGGTAVDQVSVEAIEMTLDEALDDVAGFAEALDASVGADFPALIADAAKLDERQRARLAELAAQNQKTQAERFEAIVQASQSDNIEENPEWGAF